MPVEAEGLRVVYSTEKDEFVAVENFSLSVAEGEFVGLVGESGSGKSTAALAMLGMVRASGLISEGHVRFRGEELLRRSEAELRRIRGRNIGLVVQNPRGALNPVLRVGKQIANVYRAHNEITRDDAHRRSIEALEEVGIPDPERRIRAYPHELSGGMAQRVLIAMATINRPAFLVADEPTTGLDVTVQAQILDLIRDRVRSAGASVLFVTHDLGIVAQYCDRVTVMRASKIVESGPVGEVFSSPKNEYTKTLLTSVPTPGERRARANEGPR